MRNRVMMIIVLTCFCLLSAALVPAVKADPWNKKTIVTFDQSVEISGQVLPPGTYVFQLLNANDRNIVQVFNEDGTHLYATILAIPGYRLEPADTALFTLVRGGNGSPLMVKEWFYPGQQTGWEFTYPAERSVELAKATEPRRRTEPSSTPAETISGAYESEPSDESGEMAATNGEMAATNGEMTATNGDGFTEEALAETATSPDTDGETELAQTREPRPPADSPAQPRGGEEQLPQTASWLPLLALLGTGALGAGLALRLIGKRTA